MLSSDRVGLLEFPLYSRGHRALCRSQQSQPRSALHVLADRGAACRNLDAVVSNCIAVGNSSYQGGGAAHGTWIHCALSNNIAVIGGGAFNGTFHNCLFVGNRADVGGGACLVTELSKIANCTITANAATDHGGGVSVDSMIETGTLLAPNCILYGNVAPTGANYWSVFQILGTINCCVDPVPSKNHRSFTADPRFVDPSHGDFRLQADSPCINAGNNAYLPASTDLDGQPRISGDTVDVGAYEFQNPSSTLSYAWAQQFGYPTDGSADYADPDGDEMNNWQEWQAGTDPTNSVSVLKLLAIVPTNNASQFVVTWQSVPQMAYVLEFSTNLAAPFTTLRSNIASYTFTQNFLATNANPQGPSFYRVGSNLRGLFP